MRKNKKLSKKLLLGFVGILGASALTVPMVATACSSQPCPTQEVFHDKRVSDLVKAYRNEFTNAIGDDSYYKIYTDDNVNKLIEIVKVYLDRAKVLDFDGLSVDGNIWIKSFIDELEVQLGLLESKIHYLILDPYDRLGFTNYTGWLSGKINDTVDYVNKEPKIDEEDGTLKPTIQDKENLMGRFNVFIDKVLKNLKDGVTNQIVPSRVLLKHAIGNLLQQGFASGILEYACKNNKTNPSYEELKTNKALPFKDDLEHNSEIDKLLVEKANKKLLDFIKYVTTEYWNACNYGIGSSTGPYTLTRSEKLNDVEDNGFTYTETGGTTYYLDGLGLTKGDLDQKSVGIGFMPNAEYGKKIYHALLRKHSNTKQTTNQIFNLGYNAVTEIKNNMIEVAKIVAEIYVGKNKAWSPKGEYYDEDSSGNKFGAELADGLLTDIVDASGNVDLSKFFTWLNTNRWFNGRDMKEDQKPVDANGQPILSKYEGSENPIKDWGSSRTSNYKYVSQFNAKSSNVTSVKISDIIGEPTQKVTVVNGDAGNLAYKYLVLGLSPATIQTSDKITNVQQTKSISPEAAYVGASHAIHQYLQYKDVSVNHFNGMFYNTSVDYTLRTGTGGAAYASSGTGSNVYTPKGWGGFYLDTNPYFGLQKWSMTTLATHEGVTGHVYQYNYAKDHPSKKYAPTFDSTAYAEGWGLFSEWLAVQVGMYGKPTKLENLQSDRLALPQFGVESKNVDVTQFKEENEYANGAYWVNDDKSTPDVVEPAGNSQKLFDAVQYFGFLNERQLRAMRCAVDIGIHAGAGTISETGTVDSLGTAGNYAQESGWSLNDARTFLQKNSGLGIDDVKRETKRYLEYVGQAVSYYNGVQVMEDIFMKALDRYQEINKGKDFLDWANTKATNQNTAPLFDIILRNNDVPIEVLKQAVDFYILENIG